MDTLAEEPALEAVTIDRAHQKISLATLGRADVNRLTERITNQFETAQAVSAERHCSLLTGQISRKRYIGVYPVLHLINAPVHGGDNVSRRGTPRSDPGLQFMDG